MQNLKNLLYGFLRRLPDMVKYYCTSVFLSSLDQSVYVYSVTDHRVPYTLTDADTENVANIQ